MKIEVIMQKNQTLIHLIDFLTDDERLAVRSGLQSATTGWRACVEDCFSADLEGRRLSVPAEFGSYMIVLRGEGRAYLGQILDLLNDISSYKKP